jgi:membrane-associated protein
MDLFQIADALSPDANFFQQVWHVINNLQESVQELVKTVGSGNLTAILFLIIFCETGLVVMPWLPGDSLLFVAGALCGPEDGIAYNWDKSNGFFANIGDNLAAIKYAALNGQLTLSTLLLLLPLAAIVGDNLNYWIGRYIGPKIFKKKKSLFFNAEILHRTQLFYEKHGGKMVLLARFVPLVRTFAPFVAGVGKMDYKRFFGFGVIGAFLWVFVCCSAGFLCGNVPVVKNNFEIIVLCVIIISILPAIMAWMQARKQMKEPAREAKEAAANTAGNS